MSMTDPIADMLTRIRNAAALREKSVLVPFSRFKRAIAQVLKDEGYILRFEEVQDGRFPALRIYFKFARNNRTVLTGIERVSKPSCRMYAGHDEIPWVQSGLGTVIMSTPRGVITGKQARRLGVGGEVVCKVW